MRALAESVSAPGCEHAGALRRTGAPSLRRSRSGRAAAMGRKGARDDARARHLIAPGVGHNVTPIGCAPELVAAFIERADAMTLDAGCLTELRRPPFVTSPVGWRP